MEILNPVKWSDAVREALKPAGGINAIEKEVQAGTAKVWLLRQLLIVTRLERDTFVVVAVVGKGLTEASQTIYQVAMQSGKPLLRFHTKHPKRLKNVLQLWPLELAEVRRGIFSSEYIFVMRLR